MPIAAAPVILSAAVVAAVAFLNERDKKKEVAPPPIEPPIVPPPIVPPPPIEPNVNVEPTDFPAGALLGVIGADGVNLRQEPNERSRSLGTLARGTIVELFEGGHEPATTAAPSGWERARTRSGTTGFVAAHLLTGRGLPAIPIEPQIEPERPIPPPGVEIIPPVPETTATETEEEGGILDALGLGGLFGGTSGPIPYGYGFRRRPMWTAAQLRALDLRRRRAAAIARARAAELARRYPHRPYLVPAALVRRRPPTRAELLRRAALARGGAR